MDEDRTKMVWDLWPDSERIRIAMHNTAEGYREHYAQSKDTQEGRTEMSEAREVTELRMTKGLWIKLRFDFIDEVLRGKRLYSRQDKKNGKDVKELEEAIKMLEELRLFVRDNEPQYIGDIKELDL
jgi:hypothetical protein